MTLITDCTGVILSGGKNSRLPGKKKTFYAIDGMMIMDRIIRIFNGLFDEIIIVANDPGEFIHWDELIVSDIDQSRCSLAGLHAGLYYSSNSHIFVSACDTPFLNRELILYMLEQRKSNVDVVIPETVGGVEALSSVYSKKCLPQIENNLFQKCYMIKRFFDKKRVKTIPKNIVHTFDPDERSFFNINTPEDLARAKEMAEDQYSSITTAHPLVHGGC